MSFSEKAQWTVKSVSSKREDTTGTTIQVIDNESSAVLYAYNVKKGDFQSAAEAFAKHFRNHV